MKTLIALLVLAAPLAAEEFTTDAAKAAQAKYEAALQAARDQYQADLDEAAKAAVEAGELEEVVRIKGAKDRVAGKAGDDEKDRELWIKNDDAGFFERLHTGHWVERVVNSRALIYHESSRNDEFVELNLTGETRLIRLYDDHFKMQNTPRETFKRIRGGHWEKE